MTEINHRFTLDITIDQSGIPAIQWLSEHCSLSKKALKDAMSKGAAWLKPTTGHRRGSVAIRPIRRASKPLATGEQLFLYYDPSVLAQIPKIPQLIYDRKEYSVWYKPSGMFSHGSKWGDHCAITRWVEQHHQPQRDSFLIHRLDRATSGLIIIAHNKKSAAALCQLFETRTIHKRYHAIVAGQFSHDTCRIDTPIDGKTARTLPQVIDYSEKYNTSLLDIAIETGRKHQIRKHVSELGFPIIGDRLYNPAPVVSTTPDLQLCAYHLHFDCPISHQQQSFTLDDTLLLTHK
jgi:tRNA pseudouridine32 synthase/23S rRNA pseudouridine746 synthase